LDDKLPPNARGQGHVTRIFKISWPRIISLESVKLGTSKSNFMCWLIQRSTICVFRVTWPL